MLLGTPVQQYIYARSTSKMTLEQMRSLARAMNHSLMEGLMGHEVQARTVKLLERELAAANLTWEDIA